MACRKIIENIESILTYERDCITNVMQHSLDALTDVQELILGLAQNVNEGKHSTSNYCSNGSKGKKLSNFEIEAMLKNNEETEDSVARLAKGHWPCCNDIGCLAGSVRREINRLWELKEQYKLIVEDKQA